MSESSDSTLKNLLKNIGMTYDQAVWDCHGTKVILHKALERIATYKNIVFDPPQVIEGNSEKKIVSLSVSGTMGDRSEWSIGEASPSNNKNSYPYAMAEKRAKDRVVLKLVDLSGNFYSEEVSIRPIDYYFSNSVARASKTMSDCRLEKIRNLEDRKTG